MYNIFTYSKISWQLYLQKVASPHILFT